MTPSAIIELIMGAISLFTLLVVGGMGYQKILSKMDRLNEKMDDAKSEALSTKGELKDIERRLAIVEVVVDRRRNEPSQH